MALASLARRGFLTATLPGAVPVENAVVAQASILDLPFEDRVFDCVTATLVIDRVADPPAGIQELARVLAPGGRLILSSPLSFRDPDSWTSRDGLLDLIRDAGLGVTEAFDGLVYREIKDGRGNADDWRVAVVMATARP